MKSVIRPRDDDQSVDQTDRGARSQTAADDGGQQTGVEHDCRRSPPPASSPRRSTGRYRRWPPRTSGRSPARSGWRTRSASTSRLPRLRNVGLSAWKTIARTTSAIGAAQVARLAGSSTARQPRIAGARPGGSSSRVRLRRRSSFVRAPRTGSSYGRRGFGAEASAASTLALVTTCTGALTLAGNVFPAMAALHAHQRPWRRSRMGTAPTTASMPPDLTASNASLLPSTLMTLI